MKLLRTKVMRGPNFWSNYRQHLIVAKIDLEELEQFPTNKIEGFKERLQALMPSLYNHRCSEGHKGGFFERVDMGTWMGHVMEHIALELQTLAGMECGYGRTRSAGGLGIYNVIFTYEIEEAGIYTAKAAMAICEALVAGTPYDVEADLKELRYLKNRYGLGPSTGSIVEEAVKRKIPYRRLNGGSLVQFGQGIYQKRIRATITEHTSGIGIDIAGDKEDTKLLLAKNFISVPESSTVTSIEGLHDAIKHLAFPIVVKPIDGNHGRGVTTDIRTHEDAEKAFALAQAISHRVLVERFITGHDYRLLVINYKLVAAAKRTPAQVVGDGVSTIQQLIEIVNQHPNRGEGHEKVMTKIKVDSITEGILKEKNLTIDAVLLEGEVLRLQDTANISTGGTARDVTDIVHPQNILMAERVARLVGLDICGIDVVADDIAMPINKRNGGVIEVNAAPGFRMHLQPSQGLARNVAEPVVDMLYPSGAPSRIPLVAITGTNGKTTTTRLMAHMAKTAGHKVGHATTEGIYIQSHLIYEGDCSGPKSAEAVLSDPTVDFAVLECARGGILKSGLGFDHCDISIITNITTDHLGLEGINTLADMAQVKGVVARSTFEQGYSILNADDDLVFDLARSLSCKIALFSTEADNPRVLSHCQKGGLAVTVEKGYLTICKGIWKTRVEKLINIPITFEGRASSMIKNVLPVALAGIIQGFDIEVVRTALRSFIPSPATMPGRMNIFQFKNFDLMVDYAHNPDGFLELKKFIDKTPATYKVAIFAVLGDRIPSDNIEQARVAAEMFDQIIIRQDSDPRGRSHEELSAQIIEGVRLSGRNINVLRIDNEFEALQYAIDHAIPGSFITMIPEKVLSCVAHVSALKERELPQEYIEANITNTGMLSIAS